MEKFYINAESLLFDSVRLGISIYQSGFSPNYIVGIWRGGAPVGITIQELLDYLGQKSDHIAIRTSLYTGIGERKDKIDVHGLDYIIHRINSEDRLLIVDDVFDTGLSVQAVIKEIERKARKNTPNIKVATVYYKPDNRKVDLLPDYYVNKSDKWLVFPHELKGLTGDEIKSGKPKVFELLKELNNEN